MEERYRISDPQVLKAVAHPLRVRLLGLLRTDGPATASELGRKLGESSGSTSYHLRELFKYGFVEEDERRDGRERRWRSRHRYTSWDAGELSVTGEGREAVRIMHLRQAEMVGRVLEAFSRVEWPLEWMEAAGMSDDVAMLPPAALKEWDERCEELLRELTTRYAGHPGARKVHLWFGAVPRSPEEGEER